MVNILGCRVIRDKDWMWGKEDGGSGYSGTVVGLGSSGNERSCAGTVEVCWDCGLRSNYRAGLQGKYDLKVIDTAQCGVIHVSVSCDFCNQSDIRGLRFKCTICNNYDLCTKCYHDGRHNLEHSFLRFDNVARVVPGVKLGPRLNEGKIQVKGIFDGATVVKRSLDWLWDFEQAGVFDGEERPPSWKGDLFRGLAKVDLSAMGNVPEQNQNPTDGTNGQHVFHYCIDCPAKVDLSAVGNVPEQNQNPTDGTNGHHVFHYCIDCPAKVDPSTVGNVPEQIENATHRQIAASVFSVLI